MVCRSILQPHSEDLSPIASPGRMQWERGSAHHSSANTAGLSQITQVLGTAIVSGPKSSDSPGSGDTCLLGEGGVRDRVSLFPGCPGTHYETKVASNSHRSSCLCLSGTGINASATIPGYDWTLNRYGAARSQNLDPSLGTGRIWS